MKKIILASITAFAISVIFACSADAVASTNSTDTTGTTGVISNDKGDANPTRVSSSSKKSSSSTAKSSSSSANKD